MQNMCHANKAILINWERDRSQIADLQKTSYVEGITYLSCGHEFDHSYPGLSEMDKTCLALDWVQPSFYHWWTVIPLSLLPPHESTCRPNSCSLCTNFCNCMVPQLRPISLQSVCGNRRDYVAPGLPWTGTSRTGVSSVRRSPVPAPPCADDWIPISADIWTSADGRLTAAWDFKRTPVCEVSGGAKFVSPQSTLSDSRCSVKEPSVSKTGRVRRPPGHLKDFVLYWNNSASVYGRGLVRISYISEPVVSIQKERTQVWNWGKVKGN